MKPGDDAFDAFDDEINGTDYGFKLKNVQSGDLPFVIKISLWLIKTHKKNDSKCFVRYGWRRQA